MSLERSLVLVKPPAVPSVDDVMRKLFYAGFHTVQCKYFVMSPDEILEFNSLAGNPDEYPSGATASSGPCKEHTYMAACVSKENAIDELRLMFADKDAIHVSRCCSAAHREIKFFFPNLWTKTMDHSNINETMDRQINTNVFPILSRSLLEVVAKCPPQEDAINMLCTALHLRNPLKPIIIEPATSVNHISEVNFDDE